MFTTDFSLYFIGFSFLYWFILFYSQIYWFGDLNYRITELDASTVKRLIETNSYDAILIYDQLKQNFKAERVFEKYKEGRITFKPTYKYDTGSDEWDTRY